MTLSACCCGSLLYCVAEHDYSELLLLSSDAQHAKEVALAELERVKTAARQEKETRTKALREKQVRRQRPTKLPVFFFSFLSCFPRSPSWTLCLKTRAWRKLAQRRTCC